MINNRLQNLDSTRKNWNLSLRSMKQNRFNSEKCGEDHETNGLQLALQNGDFTKQKLTKLHQ